MELARRIQILRTVVGLAQHELATKAGYSRSALAAIEQGRSAPRAGTLESLAGALGVRPAALESDAEFVVELAHLIGVSIALPAPAPAPADELADLRRRLEAVESRLPPTGIGGKPTASMGAPPPGWTDPHHRG